MTPCTATWAPFLDDVNVIIFLAPISVFDENLAEDKKVNRLVSTKLRLSLTTLTRGLSTVRLFRVVGETLWKPVTRIGSIHSFAQQNRYLGYQTESRDDVLKIRHFVQGQAE